MDTSKNNGLVLAGWKCRVKDSGGPWALVNFEEHSRCSRYPHLEFKPVYELVDDSQCKLTSDKSTVVSLTNEWLRMEDAPLGAKVQCLNEGNVAIYASVTLSTRNLFRGWYPIPRMPTWLRDGNYGTQTLHAPPRLLSR